MAQMMPSSVIVSPVDFWSFSFPPRHPQGLRNFSSFFLKHFLASSYFRSQAECHFFLKALCKGARGFMVP